MLIVGAGVAVVVGTGEDVVGGEVVEVGCSDIVVAGEVDGIVEDGSVAEKVSTLTHPDSSETHRTAASEKPANVL